MTFQEFYRLPLPYPDAEYGNHAIQTVEVSEAESSFMRLRNRLKGTPFLDADSGSYRRLFRLEPKAVVMSNTLMEARTNWRFVRQARGRVLINGLGLGWLPLALSLKPEVTSVTVIERETDVIHLVAPHLPKSVIVINADAYTYRPPGVFDFVWHDIWDQISLDNLPKMVNLMARYRAKACWQGCWSASMLWLSLYRDYQEGLIEPEDYDALMASIRLASGVTMTDFGNELAKKARVLSGKAAIGEAIFA